MTDSWTRLQKLLFQFDEPTSRLYHVNVLSSLIFILIVIWLVGRQKNVSLSHLFKKWVLRRRYWWNRSTKQDYLIYLINAGLKSLLLVPLFEFSFQISQFVIRLLAPLNNGDVMNTPTSSGLILLFTLGVFAWDDFLRFFHHWLMHKFPFLWEFHKFHHSARVLTPVTLYRTHPVESAMAILRNSLSLGVSIGLFIFIFGSSFSVWTLLGINGFGFIFNLVGANLRHSHIPLSFGPLEWLLISPIQHQVHHSKNQEHYDKNFGVSLAVWDALFGTLVFSKSVGKLKFGINERYRSALWRHYLEPFATAFKKNK
ncbi:sterol desaturase family protein [Bdellovibrio reynosensis]|uniref:Sterol desaturase family protein n=1 Tax=Bdellovibrio reynosensis TaxID=2835041 RepID=A0ABY4C8Z9_9BACT|nr:sterol desaturase family protein [Bdellovibrio reynosensis]UOF00944.1 sterol desaturase family protein [Bdellovibrio reynosensis]